MAEVSILLAMAAAALGPDDFTITIPVSPETPEGQRLVAARAREICGSRYTIGGRYRFEGVERISPQGDRTSSFRVTQELTCSDTPPAVSTAPAAPTDWQPSAQDDADVRTATMAYFDAVDAGDAARVHAMWSSSEQAEVTLEGRAAALRQFRAEAGSPGTHRIAQLTWYVNPNGAPRPGIYVAADYERSYSGLLVNCGYLIWFRESDGRYVLTREETNILAQRNVGPSPAPLAETRALMRCVER